ncbi:hypothetical protein EV401DRAFT_2012954 [Pisolithus croceorrhizus]|nr:hypothetical protein EV401DRAFT_2012954 [Pisolithus croceorrhizus]
MWKERAKHAQGMPNHDHSYVHRNDHFIKHTHLPQSIWAARVVWGRWEAGNSKVIVDVKQCPGCCHGPCRWTTTSNDQTGLGMPGLMDVVSGSYLLKLDGRLARVSKCFGQPIMLGDYGDYFDGVLIRTGNIYEDMRAAGLDPGDSYCPMVSSAPSLDLRRRMDWAKNQVVAVEYSYTSKEYVVLHQPKAVSLSANEHISLLLKDSSTRLAGKHLVTTIIQCPAFYTVDEDGRRRVAGNYSARDRGNHSTETGILTPLCIIARPHFWSTEPLCKRRKERFRSIREKFYALVDMQETGPSHKSANRQKKDMSIKFFSDLFGLEHAKNFIGKITFFKRLPSMMKTSSVSDVLSVGVTEGWSVTPCSSAD